MQHMLSVSFYIKRHRLIEKNEAPIIIRLKLHGTTRDISSGLRVNPGQWNSKFGAVKGTSESAKQINGQLTADKNKLLKIFTQLTYAGDVLIEDVVDVFQGNTVKKDYSVLALVSEHNKHIRIVLA